MKRAAAILASSLFCLYAFGWGGVGHKTVIAIAQRHLSKEAKAVIAEHFDYNIQKDAVWMDTHRTDEPIAYTTAWHVYNVDANHRYDPSPRASKGDCVKGIKDAVWCLEDYRNLTDSAFVFNFRMLIHFVGDLHCPTHSYFPGPRNFWKCSLESASWKGKFHSLYDKIPQLLYPDNTPDEIAEILDNCPKSLIRKIQKGSVEDWVKECADVNAGIYEINSPLTVSLDPQTLEKSKEIVDLELRNAGYRLAGLINALFK